MVREVASKNSDTAGDGTTAATVLAQAIVREGVKSVAAGMNLMDPRTRTSGSESRSCAGRFGSPRSSLRRMPGWMVRSLSAS